MKFKKLRRTRKGRVKKTKRKENWELRGSKLKCLKRSDLEENKCSTLPSQKKQQARKIEFAL